MSDNLRPINLNLFTIHFPIPAIVSILHRISGFVLFLLIPVMLWLLSFSFTQNGFETLHQWLGNFYVRFVLWLFLIPFCFHFVAGIRHLFMDLQMGVSLKAGKMTAIFTFIISALLIILAGVWLW